MITYLLLGERVHLNMSREDYDTLTLLLSALPRVRRCGRGQDQAMWDRIHFANEMNRSNPNFTPYQIPEKYWRAEWGARP